MNMKWKVDTLKLFRLWRTDLRNDELCEALGIPRGSLWYLRDKYKLPARGKGSRTPSTKERDAPSQEEIERLCAEIRAQWPEGEAEKRMVGPRQKRWSMPAYGFDGRHCSFLQIAVD